MGCTKIYWGHIGSRQWTISVAYENQSTEGKLLYCKLKYATDTKIIQFKKIVSGANPFDECWTDYFEEREDEKLLNSTKGREKLLTIWRR